MTPLIFLPGMMCDERLFAPQVRRLSKDRDVSVGTITQHANVQALAASVLARAPDRFALAGLSMGGIVAMEIMAQAPERITHLALLDTNPKAEADVIKAMREPQIEKVQAGELARVMREDMKPNYLAKGPQRDHVLDMCMDMALAVGPDAFVRQSRALQTRPDQQDTLRRVDVPTLILCGREDVLCPVHRHELMHDLVAGSTLRIIEGAGHLPTLEQPDETTAALTRWLEE